MYVTFFGPPKLFVPGGQTFYVVGGGDHDDVDVYEEIYVSKVNFIVSEASFLQELEFLGARRALKF